MLPVIEGGCVCLECCKSVLNPGPWRCRLKHMLATRHGGAMCGCARDSGDMSPAHTQHTRTRAHAPPLNTLQTHRHVCACIHTLGYTHACTCEGAGESMFGLWQTNRGLLSRVSTVLTCECANNKHNAQTITTLEGTKPPQLTISCLCLSQVCPGRGGLRGS